MPIRLIVGLGNPGKAYEQTRHNAGAWGLEKIAKKYELNLNNRKNSYGLYAKFQSDNIACHLLAPITFMNESGLAVNTLMRYYKIPLHEVLIMHDELDLMPGIIRLKTGGGSGGHNGIKNIINICGDNNFLRLRIGIGHPGVKALVADYVLSRPCAVEYCKIQTALQRIDVILPLLLKGENALAMQILHTLE